ncbi:MAG: TIR domain-containing protein [Leptolyngbya sp. Prado105]|jgi:hypothetical protein|nr:TIR domain-containing protein [Leptolyngbya sp. Prado105]
MRDVFISYSRKDKPFVEKLHQALEAQDRDAWVDWDDIPLSAEWWREIQRGIEGANTFVFVMSDDSVRSKVCRDEIDHAVECNKRLVPIVYREDFEMAKLHPRLSQYNWLFFRENDEFEPGLKALLNVIETDLEYVRSHTRILERAIEWQTQKRNESFVLKGDDLLSAEAWLTQGETKEPQPTELQQNYIRASRSTEDATVEAKRILELAVTKAKRVSLLSLLGVGAAVAVAVTVTGIAVSESINVQKGIELEHNGLAMLRLPTHYYRNSDPLIAALKSGREVKALLHKRKYPKSINAYPARIPLLVLRIAVNTGMQQAEFQGIHPKFSTDGRHIITADDTTSRLYDLLGNKLAEFRGAYPKFSPDGKQIITVAKTGSAI